MKTYELLQSDFGSIIKAAEGERTLWIPLDPANSDYAEYLRYTAWVEAGNSPEDFWLAKGNQPEVLEEMV